MTLGNALGIFDQNRYSLHHWPIEIGPTKNTPDHWSLVGPNLFGQITFIGRSGCLYYTNAVAQS